MCVPDSSDVHPQPVPGRAACDVRLFLAPASDGEAPPGRERRRTIDTVELTSYALAHVEHEHGCSATPPADYGQPSCDGQ
jgi:hypothetical protein